MDIENATSDKKPLSQNNEKESVPPGIDGLLPDSKYSWLVCFSSFFCLFISLGISNSFGVYQTYYTQGFISNAKPSTIAWIGTLSTAMMLVATIVSGRFFLKIGFRYTAWIGCLLGFLGLFIASFLKSAPGLIATQGILFGVGSGFVYSTAMAVTSQWFEKYRGLALGIMISGSGFGGLIISRIINAAIINLGSQWALRVTSFIYFGIVSTGALAFKPRLQINSKSKLVDFSAFKGPVFVSILACGVIGNLGYVVPIFFIPSVIIQLGGSASFASNQVTIFNIGYLVGGFIIGYLADIIGPLNMFAISAFFAGAFQLILWIAFKTKASLTALSFLYGFFAPGFVSQCISAIAKHYPADKWASYNGTYFASAGVSIIIANVIIEQLLGDSSSASGPNYDKVVKLSGICYTVASLFIIPAIFYIRSKAGTNKTWIC